MPSPIPPLTSNQPDENAPVAVLDEVAAPPRPLLIRSPKPRPKLAPGDPPLHMDRLVAYRDDPNATTERHAYLLLERCGPLVLDGVQYRAESGRIVAIPRAYLGVERLTSNVGIESMQMPL